MSQYNHHPYTYDEEGNLHQISNARKASKKALGLLALKYENALVCVRSLHRASDQQIAPMISESSKRFISKYQKNGYLLTIGHAMEAINLRETVDKLRLVHTTNGQGKYLHPSAVLETLIQYCKARIDTKAFPLGAKVIVADLNAKVLYSIAPDCECISSSAFLEGQMTKEDALKILGTLQLLDNTGFTIDEKKLERSFTEEDEAKLRSAYPEYNVVVKWRE